MKLSRIEKKLLQFIGTEFPVPFEADTSGTISTHQELPVPTMDTLKAKFRLLSEGELVAAVDKMASYQFLKKRRLYVESEFSDVTLGPGQSIRCPVAGSSNVDTTSGDCGYQITSAGKSLVDTFWPNVVKRILAKAVEQWSGAAIAAVLGWIAGAGGVSWGWRKVLVLFGW